MVKSKKMLQALKMDAPHLNDTVANTCSIVMIQCVQWIAKTSTTSFPLGIISIGPLLGEICTIDSKRTPKGPPRRERVNPKKKR